MTSLEELTEWFLDRVDQPPRMHRRGIWFDEEHAGSVLGSPDWTSAWTRWLYAPPHAVTIETFEDVCYHAGKRIGEPCRSCTVVTDAGQILYTTGMVKRRRLRYRWPMRLVMHRLWRTPPRPGRPNMGSVLWQLMVADGDVGRASQALSLQWPVMADPDFATGYVSFVLRRARRMYRQDVDLLASKPAGRKPRFKSDAQLNAEAAVPA